MKARADCIACLFRQALNASHMATDDDSVHQEILRRTGLAIQTADLDALTPAALSQPVYELVAALTGTADPYAATKAETNRMALALLPALKSLVQAGSDPMNAALHAAAAGNMIDMGIGHAFDIEQDLAQIMNTAFAIDASADLKSELAPGTTVLYVGDNAGEIVFDTLLVEQILRTGAEVVFTVKSGPIINDATMTDAHESGMTRLVEVIETGSSDIGIDWGRCSNHFRARFQSADLIIAKGHGNFETCNDRPENIYFLLKAKCEMVAGELGVALGDIVFKHQTTA